jgi:hypothetical protein
MHTTDEIIDMIQDIADALAIDLYADDELLAWLDTDDLPTRLSTGRASQAIAEIIAAKISTADEEILDQAFGEMSQTDGWQFPTHDLVLWTADGTTEGDALVVWFGNERDYDMTALGQAVMS